MSLSGNPRFWKSENSKTPEIKGILVTLLLRKIEKKLKHYDASGDSVFEKIKKIPFGTSGSLGLKFLKTYIVCYRDDNVKSDHFTPTQLSKCYPTTLFPGQDN